MSTPATRPRTSCCVQPFQAGAGQRSRRAAYGTMVMKESCTRGRGTVVRALLTGKMDCTFPPVPLLVITRPA